MHSALHQLALFMTRDGTTPDQVFGNGSDFDNAIVAETFKRVGLPVPWKYRNSRCLRTAKDYLPKVDLKRDGVHHRALDDARYQAELLLAMEAAARSDRAGLVAAAQGFDAKPSAVPTDGVSIGSFIPEA